MSETQPTKHERKRRPKPIIDVQHPNFRAVAQASLARWAGGLLLPMPSDPQVDIVRRARYEMYWHRQAFHDKPNGLLASQRAMILESAGNFNAHVEGSPTRAAIAAQIIGLYNATEQATGQTADVSPLTADALIADRVQRMPLDYLQATNAARNSTRSV